MLGNIDRSTVPLGEASENYWLSLQDFFILYFFKSSVPSRFFLGACFCVWKLIFSPSFENHVKKYALYAATDLPLFGTRIW